MARRDVDNGSRRRRRHRIVAVCTGICLLGISAALVVMRPSDSLPKQNQPAAATATITRQTLTDVVTVPGEVAYGTERLAESRITGTVTELPGLGSVIDRGEALFRIDDKPIVLFYGSLPAYRTLTAGRAAVPAGGPAGASEPAVPAGGPAGGGKPGVPATKGADVRELEQNLQELGYTGFTVDETYTEKTAAAVKRWQKDLGLPQTGDVELGRVFYAEGPIRVAQQKATPGAEASGPLLAYTGNARLVAAKVPVHNRRLVKPGTKVTVAMPNGAEATGSVNSVETPTGEAAEGGQEPTLVVTIKLTDPAALGGAEGGVVQVRFVAEKRPNVLVVPVNALLALAEGGYGLEVRDGDSVRTVAVTPGLFADGMAEVEGPGLREGMKVGVAQ
jgi:peptidoglycan hydrolase-like protein with peptidoglycan-binding domain